MVYETASNPEIKLYKNHATIFFKHFFINIVSILIFSFKNNSSSNKTMYMNQEISENINNKPKLCTLGKHMLGIATVCFFCGSSAHTN